MGEALHRGSAEGANCEACPFSRDGRPDNPVFSEWPDDPMWILVAESPGFNECRQGRVLVGATGQVVNQILHKIGRPRDHIYLGNSYLCMPQQGVPVELREKAAECCKPRLQAELAQWPGKPVLTLGAVAARALIPREVLDAIDPPDVPKNKKRQQKDKQKAQRKEDLKKEKTKGRQIEKIAKRRFSMMMKVRRDQLKREVLRRYCRRPDRAYLDRETERDRAPLWNKAWKDAQLEWSATVQERRLADEIKKARKPKKAAKKKPIKITDIVGTLFDVDIDGSGIRPLVPAIHPAALLRGGGATIGGSHTPDMAFINIIYDAAKVDALAKGRDVRLKINVEFEVVDADRATRLFLSILQEALEERSCSIDLETYVDDPDRHHALMTYVAKIRVIGIATTKRSVSVAWDLLPAWCWSYFQLVIGSIETVFHHGLYDRSVLRAYGFVLPIVGIDENAPAWQDSLLMHHAAFPGNSHRLQTVTAQFFGVGPWKAEHRNQEETPDKLAIYCLKFGTRIQLADGTTIPIEKLVRSRSKGPVLALEHGRVVSREITGWHKNRIPKQTWIEIRTAGTRRFDSGLIVTPDHRVMTSKGWQSAENIKAGDLLLDHELKLTSEGRGALIGTLLGDSVLQVSPSYRDDPFVAPRASLIGGHTTGSFLAQGKAEMIPFLVCGQSHIDKRLKWIGRGKPFRSKPFTSLYSPQRLDLRSLMSLVYDRQGSRRITQEALEALGPVGWAWWFMDDGCLQKQSSKRDTLTLATNCFPVGDLEIVRDHLRRKFGSKIQFWKDHVIRIYGLDEAEAFATFVAPFIFERQAYKLPRQLKKPAYVHWDWSSGGPSEIRVTSVRSHKPPYKTKTHRCKADNRWCLEIAGTGNFFTTTGLVANCAKDTGATHALIPALAIHVKRSKTEVIYERDKRMADIASRMHLVGMPVSREVNSQLIVTFTRLANEARRLVDDKANDPKIKDAIKHHLAIQLAAKQRKADSKAFEDRYKLRLSDLRKSDWRFNVNNPKHIAALLQGMGVELYKLTDGGSISTKKDVLEELADVGIVRDILKYRENDKMLDFVGPIFDQEFNGQIVSYGFADPWDRIHPIWSTTKISGRWAGSEPSGISNPPREKVKDYAPTVNLPHGTIIIDILENGRIQIAERPTTKRMFVAKPGRVIVGFDFSAIEARALALMSGDPFMCKVFAEGGDLHKECARVVFPGFDKLTKPEQKTARTVCKTLEYATWYGAMDETVWKGLLKEGYNFKLVDVQKSLAILRNKMSGIIRWQRETILKASQPPFELRDFVDGRRRVWPMGQVEQSQALNIVPQATGAAIMARGMEKMDERLAKYKEAYAIVQIHDAAAFECWADDGEKVLADVNACFPQEFSRDGLTIPFPIESAIGASLADV